MILIASKSMKTLLSYLHEFVMSNDACNMLIICRQTLSLTTLDIMNVVMLDCYECMNLILKLRAYVITDHCFATLIL